LRNTAFDPFPLTRDGFIYGFFPEIGPDHSEKEINFVFLFPINETRQRAAAWLFSRQRKCTLSMLEAQILLSWS